MCWAFLAHYFRRTTCGSFLVRSRKDHRGVDLVSDALSFGRLWYGDPNAVSNAKFYSRSHNAVIRVYDEAGLGLSTQSNDKLI